MAKNVVTIDAKSIKKFVKETRVINQQVRYGIFVILSQALDHIRQVAADKYIIKNSVGKNMSPWKMAKLQPAQSGRLTERTGRMLAMMRHSKAWQGLKNNATLTQTRSSITQQTMGIKGRILAMAEGRNRNEEYLATLRAWIDPSNPFIGKGFVGGGRILGIENGKISRAEKKETKATLHARFLHEHGIRGFKRQSFTPAAHDEDIRLGPIFQRRLDRIMAVANKYH